MIPRSSWMNKNKWQSVGNGALKTPTYKTA